MAIKNSPFLKRRKENDMKFSDQTLKWISLGMVILVLGFGLACNGGGGGNGGSGRLLHTFTSPGSGHFYYNPPTLVDGYIYIGTSINFLADPVDDNYFFKLDSNLNEVWRYVLESKEVRGAAALDSSGNIYFVVETDRTKGDVSNADDYLFSLDSAGGFRWEKQIRVNNADEVGMLNPAIAIDDTIYVGSQKFYALYPANGGERWTYGDSMNITNAPIIDTNGNIYFSAKDSGGLTKVFSLTSSGVEKWVFNQGSSVEYYSSPAFSTDYSKLYVGLGDKIYCLYTENGNEVWSFTPEGMAGAFRAMPAVDDENNVYIGSKADANSVFYAIRADGTDILWENEIGADLYSSPALGNDNTVYLGSEIVGVSIRLHALNMTTGATKWSSAIQKGDVTWSSPAIADDGTLYISCMRGSPESTDGGDVLSFDTDSTGLLPNAGSPRFHEGNASTGRRE